MLERVASFFSWLGKPVRAIRGLFPFSHDGRQTLIYLMCAFSAPVLTLLVMHILETLAGSAQWLAYREVARLVTYALLISVCAFSMFVAFKSLSLGGKDGLLNLNSKDNTDPPAVKAAEQVEQKVTAAAAKAVEEVKDQIAEPSDAGLPDAIK